MAYLAFKEFYDYKLNTFSISIIDFLIQFEYLNHKLGNFRVELLKGVHVFFY